MTLPGQALLAEVVAVLARFQELRVVPEVDTDVKEDGLVTASITVYPTNDHEALQALELMNQMRFTADVATMRGFAGTYGIDPARLEALLPETDVTPTTVAESQARLLGLSTAEIRAIVDALADDHLLREGWEMDLIDSALPKLRALLPAEAVPNAG